MVCRGKEKLKAPSQRLAQMARAAGIHVVMPPRRPSVDVHYRKRIKAHFPTRDFVSKVTFQRSISRTILGLSRVLKQLLGMVIC